LPTCYRHPARPFAVSSDEIVVKFIKQEAAHLVEEFLKSNVIAALCNALYLSLHLIAQTVHQLTPGFSWFTAPMYAFHLHNRSFLKGKKRSARRDEY
jgi:hypothetical protein